MLFPFLIFDKKLSPILLYGCPLWGVPKTDNTVKLQVSELPNVDKKDFIVEMLASINCNISSGDIASFRTYTKNNEISVSLHDPVWKNKIVQNVLFNHFILTNNEMGGQ